MKTVKPVANTYFGQPLGNCQDPDEPYDPRARESNRIDGLKLAGIGAQGGGSKPTPQAKRPRSSAISGSSKPNSPQRIRG